MSVLLHPFCTKAVQFINQFFMYKFNSYKREVFKFKHFSNKGYSLFASLGKEVLIGTLSVASLAHAKADGISVQTDKADTTLQAVSKEIVLGEVSITGSRAPLTASQMARMVTVLDSEAIAAAPVQSINDVLKYVAGVDVRQRGPIGAQTDISMRGGTNEQITILLNGINICDPQTGHNAFDFPADISEIERIEVLEGPAGRIYGTSSLVGAINIVTRPARQSSVGARVEGGAFGYLSAGAHGNIAKGSWNNQLSGSYTRSDGYTRSKAGTLNTDYRGGKMFWQGQYDDHNVRMNWHAGFSIKDFGSNTFYSVKFDNQFEHTAKIYTAIQAETKGKRFRFRPSIYWNRNIDRFELIRGSEDNVPFNYHRTDVFGVNLNSYFDWALGRTAFGAEFRNEDLISTNLGEPLNSPVHIHGTDREYAFGLNRSNISFHLEHNVLLKRFTLSAGFIAVKNTWNEMPMKVYPGIDASYRIGDNLKLYASFNTSLRMPSVTELYYSVGGYKADKYLKPDEMNSIEAGMRYATRGFNGSVCVYRHHGKNMIGWIRDTSLGDEAVWQSVNHDKLDNIGFETSFGLDFHALLPAQRLLHNFKVSYNYISQSRDTAPNTIYLNEYLRHKLVAALDLSITRDLNMGIVYRFKDRMGNYSTTDSEVKDYAPYSVFDARLSFDKPRYCVYLEANNIFDKDYVDYGNIPQPGIWITAGARININI